MVVFGIELGAPSHPVSGPAAERPYVRWQQLKAKMRFYTIFLEWKGGTFIAQERAESVPSAIEAWAQSATVDAIPEDTCGARGCRDTYHGVQPGAAGRGSSHRLNLDAKSITCGHRGSVLQLHLDSHAIAVGDGVSRVGVHLNLLSQYFIGYSVTLVGSIIGFFYAFGTGFIGAYVAARIYNWIVDMKGGG